MKTSATNPKLNLSLNKGKHRMVGDNDIGYLLTQCLMTKVLHILTQVIMDSKEGDPEESDEKNGVGTGEGGLSIDLGEGGGVR